MDGLSTLVDLLSARVDDTGAWSLTSDELLAALGVPPVPFWRAVHALRTRISFSDAVDGFSQDTVGDLVTLLETLLGSEAEEALAGAGLFVPHELGIELTEALLTDIGRFCAAHALRTDELAAMVRHAGSVRGAVSTYLGEYVDREALIEGCAEAFLTRHGMPEVARATAARYLRGLFLRHILDARSVVAVLEARLKLAAAEMGFTDAEERARQDTRGRTAGRDRRTAHGRGWALGVMGLDSGSAGPEVLRARYRHLMMRHHPDVDPAGLEVCKDVNVAYSLLMVETAGAG